ncbi:MAG: glycosyl transferase family 4, partial [Gemmatimonadales bacterium]|nr:glycosyl transferase family 4 [Gemmatimonadales bacterium]
QLGLLGTCLGGLGIVWATNLYNFMDGIDGLAAGESTVAGGVGALLLMTTAPSLAWVAAVLAAASGGFLVWNWPPARLFMGDVGSGFIGFVFGVLAVAGERYSSMPALLWLVLLGPFVADATITLLRRMARGERWHAAHRSHAYQRAVQAGRSHRTVTLAMLALTVVSGMAAAIIERRPVLLLPVLLASIALLAGAYVAVERVHPMGGSVEN